MTLPFWNVLSDDVSNNAIETETVLSSFSMSTRMGMWGEAMFGHQPLLGTGTINTYLSNVEKNVSSDDVSKNTVRRLSRLTSVTMTTRMGMWGESMFGSEDLLGTGILNYYEG